MCISKKMELINSLEVRNNGHIFLCNKLNQGESEIHMDRIFIAEKRNNLKKWLENIKKHEGTLHSILALWNFSWGRNEIQSTVSFSW